MCVSNLSQYTICTYTRSINNALMGDVIELSSDSEDAPIPHNNKPNILEFSFGEALKEFESIDSILKKYKSQDNIEPVYKITERVRCDTPDSDIDAVNSNSQITDNAFSSLDYDLITITSPSSRNLDCELSSNELGSIPSNGNESSTYSSQPTTSTSICKYDLDEFDDDDYSYIPLEKRLKASIKYGLKSTSSETDSQDDEKQRLSPDSQESDLLKASKDKAKSSKQLTKEEKEKIQVEKAKERQRKKEEAEREKALKQALKNANRNFKPDQAMKFVKVHIDEELMKNEYSKDIPSCLENLELAYIIHSQVFPNTITWTRKVQSHLINDNGKLVLSDENVETDEVLIILKWKELLVHIADNTLLTYIQTVKSVYPTKKLSLGVYGLQRYYNYLKNVTSKHLRNNIADTHQRSVKDAHLFKDVPNVTRLQIESHLTELQIICSISCRQLETCQDVGMFVAQFSKSVAQLPYKLEKQEKSIQAEWYMSGENKDCVKVDKDGNGLNRLWHQQLTTFPLARLETAEAITSKFATPSALMQAYEDCSTEVEAELLLQDIPIRRAAGPLTYVRKIGPELSKKVYKFFTALDGDVLL